MATRADYPDPFVKKHQEEFLEEVQNGNVEQVKNRLPSFDSLNFKIPSNGYTAFHIAVSNKCLQILEMLISHSKIDINARALKGETPLLLAVETENYDACLQLVQAGADVNLATYKNKNLIMITQVAPLHIAAEYQNTQILELLLCQDNIDVNVKKSNEETPLLSAVRENNFEAVQLLVQAGADPNATLRCPNVQSLNGATALHLAIENDNQQILHFLLSQSAVDIEIRKKDGRTPLFLAVAQSKYDAAEMLIQKGADITVCGYQNDRRDSLLHVAVKNDDLRILDLLLAQDKTIINSRIPVGGNILFYAAKNNKYEALKRIIEAGAEVNILHTNNQTALHASVKNPKCAHLLISHGVDLEVHDYGWGNTALHSAVWAECLETVCMLLYYNADANSKNGVKSTPFMESFTYGLERNEAIQDVLFDYNTEFHSYDTLRETNLIDLALQFNPRYFNIFLEKGTKITTDAFIACIASAYPDVNCFKMVWDRLKYNKKRPISLTMLFALRLVELDMIEQFLQVIIDSPNTNLLLKCVTTPSEFAFNNFNDVFYHTGGDLSSYSFLSFIERCKHAKYDIDLLTKLIFRLLENSYELTTELVTKIFSCYGYCELIKLLRFHECKGKWDNLSVPGLMLRIIFDVHTTINEIRTDFLENFNPQSTNQSQSNIDTYLAYCADRQVMSLCNCNFPEDSVPEIPKLTELARNKSREFIVKAFNVQTTCQYYTIVEELKIPQLHKRILKFEEELYQIDL